MRMSPKLPLHEWCIVLLFCAILLILAGFAIGRQKYQAVPPALSSDVQQTVMQVKIEGQVQKPGTYSMPLHSSLKDLLEQAQPLSTADLSHLKWRCKLRDGQTIHIPERRWISIQISGAVQEPGPLKILSGMRCYELADQLQFLPEADVNSIRKKRRFLQDGDVVEISTKKTKKKPSGKKTSKKKVNFR